MIRTFLFTFLLASSASAQILWDQAAPDLATAQGYGYKLYVTSPGASAPSSIITLVSVNCAASASAPNKCEAPIQQATAVGATIPGASSQLTAIDVNNGFAESPKSAPFVFGQACVSNSVKLNVGSWTRTVQMGGVGQVLYNLRQSLNPVVRVLVLMDNITQDDLTGTKLNNVAGSYFVANAPKGTHQLTVEAFDAMGCKDGGATRPMTVTVQ